MIDTTERPDTGLLDVLGARAQKSSDTRLTADAIGGMAVAIAVSVWRFPAWYLLLGVAVCFFSFGVWGISNRELIERPDAGRAAVLALRTIRALSAIAGFAAAVFLMMVVLAKTLGRIIS